MANIKNILLSAVDIAFSVFEESVVFGQYKQPTSDSDGFSAPEYENTHFSGICTSFEQKDIQKLSFGKLVQPTDLKCLIPGKYLSALKITTSDVVLIESDFYGNSVNKIYSSVAFDVDPYKVLYTLLLRNA